MIKTLSNIFKQDKEKFISPDFKYPVRQDGLDGNYLLYASWNYKFFFILLENLYFDAVEPVIKKYEKESLKKEGRNRKNLINPYIPGTWFPYLLCLPPSS